MRSLCLLLVSFALLSLLAARSAAKITVHLVPHTHDDMGWLKTVDQYTYGLNNTIQPADINAIIGSAVGALLEDSQRRFTYVETGFLYRWWVEQNEEYKNNVRKLVGEKRLQFANGGWCMHDEAAPHFIDMIDQTTLGHRFLQRELNVVPKVGWQIDPFGHSSTQAAIMSAKAGFLATYHARIDFQDFSWRDRTKQREFMWQASPSLPELVTLGGVLLHGSYGPPSDFDWDIMTVVPKILIGGNERIIDDMPWSGQNNVEAMLELFYRQVDADAAGTLDENIMWTMGSDFNYMAGQFWFTNMDKLIKAVRADGKVDIKYSTPYEYTLAKLASNVTFPVKTDDFFPYADGPHSYWTGYFTSRAALKRYVRSLSSYWTASRQIQLMAGVTSGEIPSISDAMGIMQHHDAVAGTAKQHVAFDYAKRMWEGYTEDFTNRLAKAIGIVSGAAAGTAFLHCPKSNESICDATLALQQTGRNVTVLIYNPDAHTRTAYVEIPIPTSNVAAHGPSVVAFTVFDSSQSVNNYGPESRGQPYTISVQVQLPATGFSPITLVSTSSSSTARHERHQLRAEKKRNRLDEDLGTSAGGIVVSSSMLQLTFSGATGMLSSISYLQTGLTVGVVQDWCTFPSNVGDDLSGQAGGAYIFRPVTGSVCTPLALNNVTGYTKVVATGKDFAVVESQFSYVTQRIILQKDTFDIEFTVNGIDISDGLGKELVLRLKTTIQNGITFYTDSNGREMQQRQINTRKYYPFTQTEPVAGNYYPVDTLMYIQDNQSQLNVFTDAAVGGGSVEQGEIFMTVHRRLIKDDGRGVSEPLNETQDVTDYTMCSALTQFLDICGLHYGPPLIVRGRFTVQLLPIAGAMDATRIELDRKYFSPLPIFPQGGISASAVAAAMLLAEPLDPRLQLITAHFITNNTLLVRLAHRFAVNESTAFSGPASVPNIRKIFNSNIIPRVARVDEYSIMTTERLDVDVTSVTIRPMDIRSFMFTLL
jgi:hypothetical protein